MKAKPQVGKSETERNRDGGLNAVSSHAILRGSGTPWQARLLTPQTWEPALQRWLIVINLINFEDEFTASCEIANYHSSCWILKNKGENLSGWQIGFCCASTAEKLPLLTAGHFCCLSDQRRRQRQDVTGQESNLGRRPARLPGPKAVLRVVEGCPDRKLLRCSGNYIQ